ncbi:hypothetical protein [Rufibacter ruber]|uniref:hypothetical protein n=1 Tax=Rufibacter ruber TaxID=1783499 RepID=UPI000829F4FF|nr:hypothetical protein [Rufibacter ruber]
MKNGVIFTVFKVLLEGLNYLSLVEFFKYISIKYFANPNDLQSRITASRLAVDTFIILKWLLLILAMINGWTSIYLTIIVWYLIYSNLYTYFYYHVWSKDSMNTEDFDIDRVRRRFITLMLSIGFSNLCFAYLFRFPYIKNFEWSDKIPLNTKAIWFSFANSLTANYEYVKPITQNGAVITVTQLIVSFIFLTLILGKSLPQTKSII